MISIVANLPTDRPISYRGGRFIFVRIYDADPMKPKRRRRMIAALRVQGYIRQPRERGCGYETWRLRIRASYDGRKRQPVKLADRYGIRYVTPNPLDPMIEEVEAGIIKHGPDCYEVVTRGRWGLKRSIQRRRDEDDHV